MNTVQHGTPMRPSEPPASKPQPKQRERSRGKARGALGLREDYPHYRLREATMGEILARVLAPNAATSNVVSAGIDQLADDLTVLAEYFVGDESGLELDRDIIVNHLAGIEARARALAEIARRAHDSEDERVTDAAAEE